MQTKYFVPKILVHWSKCHKHNLSKADTCLKWTNILVPMVSALDRFHCILKRMATFLYTFPSFCLAAYLYQNLVIKLDNLTIKSIVLLSNALLLFLDSDICHLESKTNFLRNSIATIRKTVFLFHKGNLLVQKKLNSNCCHLFFKK